MNMREVRTAQQLLKRRMDIIWTFGGYDEYLHLLTKIIITIFTPSL